MKTLLRPICYFVGHRYMIWRLARTRIENHKGKTRVVYDIYEATVCECCHKKKMITTKKGKTQAERIICSGMTFEQACVMVPSLKNTK